MPSIFITGSNRGLGLEWVRQYAAEGWRVFATCRHPAEAEELRTLAAAHDGVTTHRLDVTDPDNLKAIAWELEGEPLDVLVGNAGIYLEKGAPDLGALRYDDWMRTLEVNTLGSVRVVEALAGNLARGERKIAVFISSHMGSIADIESPGSYYYRSSKAALNAAAAGIAAELGKEGVGVLILHPGGVRTRMGPRQGAVTPAESVTGMRRVLESFTPAMTGRFYRFDGSELPW